jgi:F-type H+-transporting ATPase subunit delta
MPRAGAARRYAKALFSLARDDGRVAEVRGELARLGALFAESAELRSVLLQPLYPGSERRAVLRAICERLGASQLFRNFQAFLVDQRRLVDWAAIEEEYARLADAEAGLRKARVRTASPLSSAQRERLERALERRTGGRIELEIEVDPALVGGAVAQVGDTVFDGSLRTQLQQLRASLARG